MWTYDKQSSGPLNAPIEICFVDLNSMILFKNLAQSKHNNKQLFFNCDIG